MTRGLYLGKFMPIHHGHLWVIDTAAQLVDELTVLVCAVSQEPIDGRLRSHWVRSSVSENIQVRELFDDSLPQQPEDDPDFWPKWRDALSPFGPFDYVFGGEDYVVQLAYEIGAVAVPLGRSSVNISATMIRNAPHEHWRYIPTAVRAHFQRRVTFLGPESTGKSTLSARLAQRLDPSGQLSNLMTEYGRIYDASLKQGQNWTRQDFRSLTRTHIAMRNALAKHAGPYLIEDTDLIQTMAWQRLLMGEVDSQDYPLQDFADLYLLLSPDVPWIDDGTRYGESFRVDMFEFLKTQLECLGLRFVVIDGNDWNRREQLVNDAVEKLLNLSSG
ncbi:AAA family ATPase [Motilimonas sp. E26]|uniref:AAA family ATPase n=1 Tax=Motilimonas sp. E26 TaxID=2865674 RepID=UPI001E58D3B0|nr:AAA family ATPase [Motilimonas sp. E26]